MSVPKLPPKPNDRVQPGQGVADPRYLVGEIEELKTIANQAGFRLLAYLLECAATEARAQIKQPDTESWDGIG